MKKTALFLALITVMAVILTSCGASVTGTWEHKEETFLLGETVQSYTFNSDKTGVYSNLGYEVPFTYETDGDTLTLKFSSELLGAEISNTTTYTYSVKSDKLTLTEGNTAVIFTKVN